MSSLICWALLACSVWGSGDAFVNAPLPKAPLRPAARQLATCRSEVQGARHYTRRTSRRAVLSGMAAAPVILWGARRSQAEEEEWGVATSSVVFVCRPAPPLPRCCTSRAADNSALKRSRLPNADKRDCRQGKRNRAIQGPLGPILCRGAPRVAGLAPHQHHPVLRKIVVRGIALRLTGSWQVVPPEEGDDAAAAAAIREGVNPKKRAIYLQQSMQPSVCIC